MIDVPSTADISWLLHKAGLRLKPALMRFGEQNDLTGTQLFILLSMQPGTSVPMHSVSEALTCDASNITGSVERLVSRELLSRQENPEDRRVKILTLTQSGQVIRQKLVDDLDSQDIPALASLSGNERVQLVALLQKIAG